MPNDPVLLLSWVNTQLRDAYASLEELCAAQGIEASVIEQKLESIDYIYDRGQNRFR